MSENNNLNFKMRVADWQGYVRKSLESIEKRLENYETNMTTGFEKINKKLDKANSRVNRLYVKVGTLGGSVALVVSLLMWLLTKFPWR